MIELLLTAIETDGTLTVIRTDDCYIRAQYDNRLAAGPFDQEYEIDGGIVRVVKGAGEVPEMLTVLAFGLEHSASVADNETGAVCVPYWSGV